MAPSRKFNASEVARISRIALAEDEIKQMEKDLESILEAFGELDKAKTDCEPSFQPLPIRNVTREDEIEKSLSQEEALSQTIHKEKGFFRGPRAI